MCFRFHVSNWSTVTVLFGGKIQAWSAVDLFWVCHYNSLAFVFLEHSFKIFRQYWGRETCQRAIKGPYAISYFTRTNMFPGIWIFTRLLLKCCWILLTISSTLLHCSVDACFVRAGEWLLGFAVVLPDEVTGYRHIHQNVCTASLRHGVGADVRKTFECLRLS